MTRQQALDEGYKVYCLQCNAVAKEVPTQQLETGHGSLTAETHFCPRCGDCDLWANLADDSAAR